MLSWFRNIHSMIAWLYNNCRIARTHEAPHTFGFLDDEDKNEGLERSGGICDLPIKLGNVDSLGLFVDITKSAKGY